MARWVSSMTSRPGLGSLSYEESGMSASYPTPCTSTVTWVGKASTNFPCKYAIIAPSLKPVCTPIVEPDHRGSSESQVQPGLQDSPDLLQTSVPAVVP